MVFGNGVKNTQAAAYNGARTVDMNDTSEMILTCCIIPMKYENISVDRRVTGLAVAGVNV